MNKANVLKAMITQRTQEYRTLASRFPSFLPIRFIPYEAFLFFWGPFSSSPGWPGRGGPEGHFGVVSQRVLGGSFGVLSDLIFELLFVIMLLLWPVICYDVVNSFNVHLCTLIVLVLVYRCKAASVALCMHSYFSLIVYYYSLYSCIRLESLWKYCVLKFYDSIAFEFSGSLLLAYSSFLICIVKICS